ncbi:hypothetical protein PG984_003062 [Apiospora sp. TS-2023a]
MRKFDDADILAAFHSGDANDEQDGGRDATGASAKRQQPQQHQITFEAFSSPDPMAYDVVVAVSELGGGALDVTLSFWRSVVDERDARRALDCLKSVMGLMGRENDMTCAEVAGQLAV